MSLRVFEVAKKHGVDSKELIHRISSLGIRVTDHLAQLDRDTIARIDAMFASAPTSGVVQQRVNATVRVRKRVDPPPAPVAAPAPIEMVAPTPEPAYTPALDDSHVTYEPEPEPVHPSALEGPPAIDGGAIEASPEPSPEPAPTQAGGAEPAPSTPPVSVVSEAPARPAAVPSTPGSAVREAQPLRQPRPAERIDRPTMERAVVVTQSVDPRVAKAVAQTRAEKGYDIPLGEPQGEQGRDEAGGVRPLGAEPPRGAIGDKKKPAGPGKRLVIDNRRERLVRKGMVDVDDIFRGGRGKKKRPKMKRPLTAGPTTMKEAKKVVRMGEAITVGDLAQAMMVKSNQVVAKLMGMGVAATVNQAIDFDTAAAVADEFEWRVESHAFALEDYLDTVSEDDKEMESRPPVVTIMGHVDHGKTSLLDHIRHTRVVDKEHGGITQHMGAYTVEIPEKGTIVFIDTPGHEAFTAMRARGAQATDIVVLVVAADDGVMPQTKEAIAHAKAADVPIIVAVNKIDKPNINVDRVLKELSENGLTAEEWGGQTVVCKVSALKGTGIEHLLDMILLQAEVMELEASRAKPAKGLVLEGRLERGRGPVATLLIQEGVLEVGDNVVAGAISGRVRAMSDDLGRRVKEAGPSTPVEVIGLSGVPEAGEVFYKVKDDKAASKVSDHQTQALRVAAQVKTPRASLENIQEMLKAGTTREIKVIVKADVHGSAEALTDALSKLIHPEVSVKVIHTAVGGIIESDVNLASASDAIIIGFGVRPEAKGKQLAEREKVDIRLYNIIYDAIEDVKKAMAGLLAPVEKEKALGRAEVRQIFSAPKIGTIAGSFVLTGKITRSAKVRVMRNNAQVFEGQIASLRRFKDDAREVAAGYECGIGVANFNDVQVGDILEAYEIEKIAASLE